MPETNRHRAKFEHAGATSVVVRVRARRSAIELHIWDDGMGFKVERALAKAA